MIANEIGAMQEIKAVDTAEVMNYSQYGKYASSLQELAQAGMIPASSAQDTKGGYRFTLSSSSSGYEIHADPVEFGKTGRRSFYSDQSAVIHQNWGPEPATANSPQLR